eukprot:Colp12_sorted_trinity150504_noHs@16522
MAISIRTLYTWLIAVMAVSLVLSAPIDVQVPSEDDSQTADIPYQIAEDLVASHDNSTEVHEREARGAFGMRGWAMQLGNFGTTAMNSVRASTVSIAVIPAEKGWGNYYTATDLAYMRNANKKVIGYFCIGEANVNFGYWQTSWSTTPPAWLGPVSTGWTARRVRFWMAAWQTIIFNYLDKIINSGYDGVYIDRIDSFEFWASKGEIALGASADAMVRFVAAIAARARARRPGFLIVPQNGLAIVDRSSIAGT